MNALHDCGGMQCYGPVKFTPTEPMFHARWESRVLALNVASWYVKNADLPGFRSDIEGLAPIDYLRMSYWQIWFEGLVHRLVANKWISAQEAAVGRSKGRMTNGAVAVSAEEVVKAICSDEASTRSVTQTPRFALGAQVRARNSNPIGHTRLPRYVRGKVGVVVRNQGAFDFPDTDEYGQGPNPNHVYSVRFAARELWGEAASPRDFVYVDLWERYLELV